MMSGRRFWLLLVVLLSIDLAHATYTKIGNSGVDLADDAALGSDANEWACTRDNETGLVWEVKSTGGGWRDMNLEYTNFDRLHDPANVLNAATNSIGFVNAVNQAGLCGFFDWRRPNEDELLGLVSGYIPPFIDSRFFPNSSSANYWSASPLGGVPGEALGVNFAVGGATLTARDIPARIRLVRGGPAFDSLTLSVLMSGSGAGDVAAGTTDCVYAGIPSGIPCTSRWGNGSTVTLTASPAPGSAFTGWSGACAGASPTCTVSLAAARTVAANFTRIASAGSLVAHPTSPGLLWVGLDGGGVYKSTNDGSSWSACATQPENLSIRSLLLAGTTLYAGTAAGVYKSADQCATWTALNNGLPN